MALPDLTGRNIQDTYQRVLHTDGTIIYDGTGSIFVPATASHALTAVSASHEITYELSSSYAETASFIANDVHSLTSTEVNQLKNIGSNAISNVEWGYVAGGQAHGTGDSPRFNKVGVSSSFQHLEEAPGATRPTITNNDVDRGIYLDVGGSEYLIGFIHEGATVATIDIFGNFTGQSATVATIAGLAPDTATTQATQGNITSIANLSTIGTITTGNVDAILPSGIYSSSLQTLTNITASGDISASGTLYGINLSGTNTGDQNISNLAITGSNVIFGNITASGDISASGHISASAGVGADFVVRPNLYWFANCDAVTFTEATNGDFPSTNTATASFSENINSNSSIFTLADDTLTITRSGLYKFTYNLTLEVKTDSNRTEGAGAIIRTSGTPALIDGSVVYTYNRFVTASPGISRTTGTATVLIDVVANDEFKILFVRHQHTSTSTKLQTVPRGTSWYVEAVT